jgi:NAD(P)-dependent dehydrogenase (short-subunit alcohol dehydrogenase family)
LRNSIFPAQFGTNHLGHYLLTELLLPLVHKSAEKKRQPRIVIVSSEAHRYYPINW